MENRQPQITFNITGGTQNNVGSQINEQHNTFTGNDMKTQSMKASAGNAGDGQTGMSSPLRQETLDQLQAWMERAPWLAPASAESVCRFLRTVLGIEEDAPLTTDDDRLLSAKLWRLMEQGRGDRAKITAMNITGYFVGHRLLEKGSPALAKTIFGSDENYPNIDKGNPDCCSLSKGFEEVVPLFDKYLSVAKNTGKRE